MVVVSALNSGYAAEAISEAALTSLSMRLSVCFYFLFRMRLVYVLGIF